MTTGLFIKHILDNTEGLFSEARKGKKINIILVFILPIVLLLISDFLVAGLFYVFATIASLFPSIIKYSFQIKILTTTLITIILYFLFVKFVEKRKISSIGLKVDRFFLFKYLKGFLIGILMMEIVAVTIIASGNGILVFNDEIDKSFIFPFIITLLAWIVQGASEEIMMRGHMMPKLGIKVGSFFAIIISSFYFSLLHLANPGISKIALVNLVLFGIFSSIYALQERGIIGVCALHSAWNFAQGNIFGFLVSGLTPVGGSFIITTVTDNRIITGGSFGPEGGLAVTFVLLLGIFLVSFHSFKNGSSKYNFK